MAAQYAEFVLGYVDGADRFLARLSLFDLLWVGLAVSSAWKIMRTPLGAEEESEDEPLRVT